MAFGFLKKIGKGIGKVAGKVGKAVGKVGKVAVPVLAATTGMGLPLAAALGAGSGLLSGGGIKGALKGAVTAGGAGLAGKALGTRSLLGKAKNLILGGGQPTGPTAEQRAGAEAALRMSPQPADTPYGERQQRARELLGLGDSGDQNALPKKWDAASQQWVSPSSPGSGLPTKWDTGSQGWISPTSAETEGGGILSKIKDFITRDPARAAGIGLAAGNLISGAGRAGRADERLRQAEAGLVEPEREDLSDLYDTGNPYARPRRNRALDSARMALAGGY